LIDVTRLQVLGAGEVIKFVPKDPVPISNQEMEEELRGRETQNDRGAAGVTIRIHSISVGHEYSRSGDLKPPSKSRRFVNRRSLMLDLHRR
jgi:hypothetical protein